MDGFMEIRPARMSDAVAIGEIINYHAERGRMLHRSLEAIYDTLRNFLVADADDEVLGCVAVEIAWADLAELKSLAVAPHAMGRGVGAALVQAAIADAHKLGVRRLFALTYVDAFFARHGFEQIDRRRLPSKVWTDCVYCPRRHACDEIAMLLDFNRLDAPAPPAAQEPA
jgi:amino-acid N-acetyltransferase